MGESPWQARLRQVCGRNEHLLQRANGASRLVLPWLDQGGPEDGQPGGPEWLSNREDVDEVRARHQEGFA